MKEAKQGSTGASRSTTLALGPLMAAVVWLIGPGDTQDIAFMAAIAVWMAVWWITEAVPLAVTALLPLVAIPITGIAPVQDVAVNYGRPIVFLFLGGFLLALGLQVSQVHKRIALHIVSAMGSSPPRLILGFMVATWFLSMWVSNTSTTMLMLPIALSVLKTARDQGVANTSKIAVALLLGIAYSANIGGMATLVGTPPNLVFHRIFRDLFPEAPAISFLQWSLLAAPLSVCFLTTGWVLLTRVIFPLPATNLLGEKDTLRSLITELGPLRRDEIVAGTIFALTALLWITGSDFVFGETTLPGWRGLLGLEGLVDDAVVAVAMAILLFAIPSRDRPGEHMLEWRHTSEVPWGLLLIFGGGIALARNFTTSGLSAWAGHQFEVLTEASPLLLLVSVCILLTLLTELTSNLATTDMLLPILATAAVTLGLDPRFFMIPATLSASCAFMMPVATPPATIIFGSGLVPIKDMVRAGIWFNLLGIILIPLAFLLLGGFVYGVDLLVMPSWAH